MSLVAKPNLREFRDDAVGVARLGQSSLAQIPKDFGSSEGSLANWMKNRNPHQPRGLTPTDFPALTKHQRVHLPHSVNAVVLRV